jgi:TonB family protein
MRFRFILCVACASFLCAQTAEIETLRQATVLHPTGVKAHLDLGQAFLRQWIPGAKSAENQAAAHAAEIEFRRVLELDANNPTALASMATLSYNSAMVLSGQEKTDKLNESMAWYQRLATADPTSKVAYFSMGDIAWAKWYPAFMAARASAHMKREDPGPLPNPERQNLKTQYSSLIDEGISNLERALQLDPDYSDAMAYLNLLIRERADLRDTKQEYAADIAAADNWVQSALQSKKRHAQSNSGPPPPTPPPPTPTATRGEASVVQTPTRIRVDGNVQESHLIQRVGPVYPTLARQARISGIVRFTIIIAKDGSVLNMQLISGHPLLVAAAQEALKQYRYSPTLLNGAPVEVVTMVDVPFVLPN